MKPVWQADDVGEARRAEEALAEHGIVSERDGLTVLVPESEVLRALDLLEAAAGEPPASGRFERSVRAMDANAWDADGRWRLSSAARMDYAFWDTLFAGPVGWIALGVTVAVLAALFFWLYG